MGLLDQVLGGLSGSRGQGAQSMSPIVKALLMVLAAKAYQHYTSPRASNPAEKSPGGAPVDPGSEADPSGSLADITGSLYPRGQRGSMPGGAAVGESRVGRGEAAGDLGGLLAGLGGAAGLESVIDHFRRNGYGDAIDSWVGRGQNQRLAPQQLENALGPDALDELGQQTGMQRDDMLTELSTVLPEAVDEFTPEGRPPTEREMGRWV